MPSHHLGLVGARVVQTAEVLLSRRAIRDVLSARALGVMHGPAGSGKTFAAQLAVGEFAVARAWVQFPSRPTMLHVARRLYRELAGADPGCANRFDLSEELIALLAGREWLLVVDEAQWLNRECIEYLRHLHDHPRTRFSLLLVGGDGCWRVLSTGRRSPARIPPVTTPPIVWDPIPFGPERKAQMVAYVRRHYGSFMKPTWPLIDPHVIVIHFSETTDFQSTYNTFALDTPDSELHELPDTCAHFVIDRAGVIHQLVPLDTMCRHTVGLNWTAIGIEHVGYSDQQVLDNPRQMAASLRLVRWLRCRVHVPISDVIGHNESLTSRYHREDVPALRTQTHGDFNHADMQSYRARLRAAGPR